MACKGVTWNNATSCLVSNISCSKNIVGLSPRYVAFPKSNNNNNLSGLVVRAQKDGGRHVSDNDPNNNQQPIHVEHSLGGLSGLNTSHSGSIDSISSKMPMGQLQDTMERLLEGTMWMMPATMGMGKMRRPWDVTVDDSDLKMRFDVPGLSKEDFNLSMDGDMLVIEVHHKEEQPSPGDDKRSNNESHFTRFRLLDCEVENIRANLKDDILCISVPKATNIQIE